MNEKSEQIDSRLNILLDRDQPLSSRQLDATVVGCLESFGSGKAGVAAVDLEMANGATKRASFVFYKSEDVGKHAFLTAAVTFLGGHGNHPVFKKRIQLKEWYKVAHATLSLSGFNVHFFGVYHYAGNVVYVDFAPKTYLKRKMHNSSAFVYVNDLFRAMKDGVAVRADLHGNVITTIRRDRLCSWLSKYGIEDVGTEDLVGVFSSFNKVMPFSKWLRGVDVIPAMQKAGWSQWRQTEWAGWYLEFRFAKFLADKKITIVKYQGTQAKKDGDLDFDLLFPTQKFYGDLKASDEGYDVSPGNDQGNVLEALDKYDRFWYVIYEHETVKDKQCGGEVCKFRYEYLRAVDGKAKSPTSYISRMKNRVNFKRMMILELNRANCGEILSAFNQGHQPNMGKRAPKFKISKTNVENFQVFHYQV